MFKIVIQIKIVNINEKFLSKIYNIISFTHSLFYFNHPILLFFAALVLISNVINY